MSRPAAAGNSAPTDDLKLHVLQLQCIIDAKDREILLLRKQLSGESSKELDEIYNLRAENAKLRGEIQKLTLQRSALCAQPGPVVPPARVGDDIPQAPADAIPAGTQQQVVAGPEGRSSALAYPHNGGGRAPGHATALSADKPQPVSPSAVTTVDPGVLVEKLRGLVSGLVAEALAAQHQRPIGQSPSACLRPTPIFQAPQAGAAGSPNAGGQGRLAAQSTAAPWAPAPAAPATSAAAPMGYAASAADTLAVDARWAWPGIQVVVQQLPPVLHGAFPPATPAPAPGDGLRTAPTSTALPTASWPLGAYTALGVTGVPAVVRTAAAAPATWTAGCGGSGGEQAGAAVPAPPSGGASRDAAVLLPVSEVLELNVDGTLVLLERDLLDSQAAGSKLHRMLVHEYGKLPRDAQGRPYLSYDPRVFQLLMSYLKERHLFGGAAAGMAAPRDWGRAAEALGVSIAYLAQVASHLGLANLVLPAPPPQLAAAGPSASSSAGSALEGGSTLEGQETPPSSHPAFKPSDPHSSALDPELHDQPAATATPKAEAAQSDRGVALGLMGQPWEHLPSVRVATQPPGSSAGSNNSVVQLPGMALQALGGAFTGDGHVSDASCGESGRLQHGSGGAVGLLPAGVTTSAPAGAQADAAASSATGATVTSSSSSKGGSSSSPSVQAGLGSSPSSSRIPPPPPPLRSPPRPPAPAAVPAAAARSANGGPASLSGTPDGALGIPFWWQPFPDDLATSAMPPQNRRQHRSGCEAAAAEPAVAEGGALPVGIAAAAVGAAVAGNGKAAASGALQPPGGTSRVGGPYPAVSAAYAAAVERYTVPNLYAVLAEKGRVELESDAGVDREQVAVAGCSA